MNFTKKVGSLGVALAALLLSSCGNPPAEEDVSAAQNANAADVVFMGKSVV